MADSSTSRRPSNAGSDLSVDSQDPNVSLKRVGLSKEFATTQSGASCKLPVMFPFDAFKSLIKYDQFAD